MSKNKNGLWRRHEKSVLQLHGYQLPTVALRLPLPYFAQEPGKQEPDKR